MTKQLEKMTAEELHAHLQKLVREWNNEQVLKAEKAAVEDRFSRQIKRQLVIEHFHRAAEQKGGEKLLALMDEIQKGDTK